ncbi:hypothetical protein P171DRAFT_364165 [Karstenula rhodostoma CBS 690.94]|uniref:Uncharacterized protein n=1 Tax=Karstenula rhodostoma CBS 690.94 TaxID=1392251 RepID=A0A9P4U9Y4_9PLEO|nr:hypothetical protein P171DRAFT_364165 [Karstenula rhodostoma CBS 690.94]
MAADEGNSGGGKMFSEDTVAVLLMAVGSVSISSAQYAMMSSLDGTKTASSFQHSFRSVLKKAKELKARADTGESFEPVAPTPKKRGAGEGAAPPMTPKKPKATPKSTPKATPKGRGKKGKVTDEAPSTPADDRKGLEFEEDIDLDSSFKKEDLQDDLI